MAPSNLSVLTRSHTVVAAKKRFKRTEVKEVLFDEDARRQAIRTAVCTRALTFIVIPREFLTGFHKRKLEKKEVAKTKALAREKLQRQEARREVRLPRHTLVHKVYVRTDHAHGPFRTPESSLARRTRSPECRRNREGIRCRSG